VNLFQVVNTVSAFLPLIEKGQQKKIIYISSGIGDIPTTRATELPNLLGYAISKAAGNILMAKYAVDLKAKGILTLSLSPGWVETDACESLSMARGPSRLALKLTYCNSSSRTLQLARGLPVDALIVPKTGSHSQGHDLDRRIRQRSVVCYRFARREAQRGFRISPGQRPRLVLDSFLQLPSLVQSVEIGSIVDDYLHIEIQAV
jgi:NAD(P)-dependent dehydrogenase (short-subunit alcohol dehydrogenase family)